MSGFFFVLLMGALLAVLASLGVGMFAMARGRTSDLKLSNRMMRWRIIAQAIAIAVFMLYLWVRGG